MAKAIVAATSTRALVVLALVVGGTATAGAQTEPTAVETVVGPARAVSSEATLDAERLQLEAPRSANDLLRAAPGAYIVQHGAEGKGLQIFLRGVDAVHGSDFALSLEGIPLNEVSNVHGNGYLDLTMLLPEVVESLHVRRGVVSVEQGNFATAGSADVQLRRTLPTSVSYAYGTPNRHRVRAVDGRHGVVAADALWDAGFGEGRAAHRATVNVIRPLGSTADTTVDALALLSASQFELPGLVRLDDVERGRVGLTDSYAIGHGESLRSLIAVATRHRTGAWRLRMTPFVTARHLQLEDNVTGFAQSPSGDLREQRHTSLTAGVHADASRRDVLGGALRLTSDVHHTRFAQRDHNPDRTDELRAGVLLSGVGAGWQRVFGPLEAGVALRTEVASYHRRGEEVAHPVFAPRATLRAYTGPITWSAAAGRGYRFPSAQVAFDDAPTPALASSGEVGARLQHGAVDAGVAAFVLHTDREAFFDHVAGTTLELDAARRVGVEVDVQLRPHDRVRLGVDGTVVDARFATSRQRVPNVPNLVVSGFARVAPTRNTHVALRSGVVALRNLAYGARAADALGVTLTAGADLGPFEVDLAVENLLARAAREGEVNYASDWRAIGGGGASTPAVHLIAAPPLNARIQLTYNFGATE